MTVGDKSDDSKFERFYVHIQSVPSGAGRQQVREFFSGLQIASGGISFSGRGAFVVFYNRDDALAAVQMSRRRLLQGMVMRVSNVERKDMRRSQMENTRRKLVMDWAMEQTVIPPAHTDQSQQRPSKRIRPTTVTKETKSMAKKFCPDEVEKQGADAGQSIAQRSTSTATTRSMKMKQHLKTIKPTPVLSLKQFNLAYEQEVF